MTSIIVMRESLPGNSENIYFSSRIKDLKEGKTKQNYSLVQQDQAFDELYRYRHMACQSALQISAQQQLGGRSRNRRGKGYFFKYGFYLFQGRREKERDIKTSVMSKTTAGCLLHTLPHWGSSHNPSMDPDHKMNGDLQVHELTLNH